MGLQMFERYGMDSPIANFLLDKRLLSLVLCMASLFVALLIIFLAFLAAKVDGAVTWNWASVFAPLWIIDFIVFTSYLCMVPRMGEEDDEDEDDGDHDAADAERGDAHRSEGGRGMGGGKKNGTPADVARAAGAGDGATGDDVDGSGPERDDAAHKENRRQKRQVKRLERFSKWRTGLNLACFLAWQILLVVRLDTGAPEWVLVWVPAFIAEGFNLIANLLLAGLIMRIGSDDPSQQPPLGLRVATVLNELRWWVVRTLLIIFIALRSDNDILWNWALVFLPLFAGVALALVLEFGEDAVQLRQANVTADERTELRRAIWAKAIGLSVVLLLGFAFVGMLIVRLNETSPPVGSPTEAPTRSMAVVLVPVYIVVSFLFCCCCCFLPCLLSVSGGPGDDALDERTEILRRFNQRPQRYIEASPNGPQPAWTVNMV